MHARHRWSCLLASLLTCLATMGTAEGADEQRRSLVHLEWARGPGAESCSSEAELVEDVEVALARRVFTDRSRADRVLRAEIHGADTPPRWVARVALATRRGRPLGERELTIDSQDCTEASQALALALALMIDLPPTPQELEERRLELEEERRRTEERRRRDRWPLSAGIGPSAAVDSAPTLSLGAHAMVFVVAGRLWPIVADGFFWVQSESVLDDRTLWLAHGMLGLGVCPLSIQRRELAIAACLGPQAEIVTGWGTGFPRDLGGVSATFGGLARSSLTYRLTEHVRTFVTLGVAATPQRIDFTFLDDRRNEVTLHRTAPVKALASFGLAIDFF